jgi:hypothetical protein
MAADLQVDWCEYQAAKFSVENWHYSGCMPAIKNVNLGVWESGNFIGAVVFSRPANANLGDIFSLDQSQFAELTRVALDEHQSPVSQIVTYAIKKLKTKDPGLKCLFSYADPVQNHTGTIYQAMNWYYLGRGSKSRLGREKGKTDWKHSRQIQRLVQTGRVDRENIEYKTVPGKHKYVYPLDDEIEHKVKPMSQPYP